MVGNREGKGRKEREGVAGWAGEGEGEGGGRDGKGMGTESE